MLVLTTEHRLITRYQQQADSTSLIVALAESNLDTTKSDLNITDSALDANTK